MLSQICFHADCNNVFEPTDNNQIFCSSKCEANAEQIAAEMEADREEFEEAVDANDRAIYEAEEMFSYDQLKSLNAWLVENVAEHKRYGVRAEIFLFVYHNEYVLASRTWAEIWKMVQIGLPVYE